MYGGRLREQDEGAVHSSPSEREKTPVPAASQLQGTRTLHRQTPKRRLSLIAQDMMRGGTQGINPV